MKLIKVAAVCLNQTPLAWEENLETISEALAEARSAGASVVCMPELCISGYNCEDMFHAPGVCETAWNMLQRILPETAGMVVSFGLPLRYQNAVFDAACLAVDGRIAGFVAKRYLASEGIYYEPRWFKPWPQGTRVTFHADGKTYALGDWCFEVGGIRLGFEICEDAWAATRPGSELAARGVDIILNPSASHFSFRKIEIRRRFVLEGARAFGVSYVYSNLLGNEAGRAIYDGGALIASGGELVAQGPRFSFKPFVVTTAVVDVDATRVVQARSGTFRPAIEPESVVEEPFRWPETEPEPPAPEPDPWEAAGSVKEEEFARAEALALFDYMRKSRARGFVVSLSGGADSTTCSVLVSLMVRLGLAELGWEGFLKRANLPALHLKRAFSHQDLLKELLLCVYQSTKHSSETTRNAARTVAEALGAQYVEFDVQKLVDGYTKLISGALGRALTWEQDDMALQNIQARVRAPSAWFLANVRGAILLTTSNRSEAAVGYATMDGDTCGGLAPLAGIDKTFVRHWLKWAETQGPHGVGPMPFLSVVTSQVPTAELRPPEAGQTDEGELMPYEVLDEIERAAIRDKLMPIDIFRKIRTAFPQYGRAQIVEWIERFFRLWCRNQWKRERYAPSFHLDDENLDPKTWCRFPILSGGFKKELRELRSRAAGKD